MYDPLMVQPMRDELTRVGYRELKTAEAELVNERARRRVANQQLQSENATAQNDIDELFSVATREVEEAEAARSQTQTRLTSANQQVRKGYFNSRTELQVDVEKQKDVKAYVKQVERLIRIQKGIQGESEGETVRMTVVPDILVEKKLEQVLGLLLEDEGREAEKA